MATVDEPYVKPHAIQDLSSARAAVDIDDNFDAIYRALQKIRAAVNTNASSTTSGTDDAFVMAMSGV